MTLMNNTFNIHIGDNQLILPTLPDNSVDSIVTDPPYELGFMGKSWDATGIAYNVEMWRECLRVLKPGGHLLAFSGSRTYHRMAVAIEDAGFQIRDQIMWVYGSGFPKSLNISKAIDKAAGVEREVIGKKLHARKGVASAEERSVVGAGAFGEARMGDITAPATAEAKEWDGWGTALKPAHEPIVLARKPLEGTVANNVLTHGVGGINIDGCRVGDQVRPVMVRTETVVAASSMSGVSTGATSSGDMTSLGRFPANFIHDGSDEVLELFPDSKGMATQRSGANIKVYGGNSLFESSTTFPDVRQGFNDNGSAARFFYCAKANKKDRNEGLDGFEEKQTTGGGGLTADTREDGSLETASAGGKYGSIKAKQSNTHPTVKPTDLMRYLCRLITPPNGVVLDPFTGSGSTGKAALLEGFNFIGIEQSPEYAAIAQARMEHVAIDE